MKALVVYYSRSGTTKKVADSISTMLKCDIEEIIDEKNRKGIIGFIKSGRDAMKKSLTTIKPMKLDPANYDLVIIGTPIWASTFVPAVRAYIENNKDKIKAIGLFFSGGETSNNSISQMEELIGKKAKASLGLTTKEVKSESYIEKVKEFVKGLA